MASLRRADGRYILQFTAPDKRRRTICLGSIAKRDAETVKGHVETIVASMFAGHAPPDETSRWLSRLADGLHDKLAAVGLREQATLGPWLDSYINGRDDVKDSTLRHLRDARKSMVEFFGENRELKDITPGDADDFRRWMARTLGENTVRRRCGRAKQFFRAAVRKRLMQENPFGDMKGCSVNANKEREYFVTRAEAAAVLDTCPDSEWRLLFALSRFGGLRCPSEHLGLTWADINWELNRMTVHSPKTEHHEGGESRVVPIFPELLPYLQAAWDEAPEGSTFVIRRYRDVNANLRTPTVADHQTGGAVTVAQAVPKPAGQPGDGTGRRASRTRCRGLAGAFDVGCPKALLASDRCRFRQGHRRRWARCKIRRSVCWKCVEMR